MDVSGDRSKSKSRAYQICSCCVMDTTDEDIVFDSNGICMRCNEYKERILPDWKHGEGHETELIALISQIKKSGKNKRYDCIVGISGGVDSSYLLHLAVKEWGLRPYVYHVDTGWDLPVAKDNINKITEKLGVELHTDKLNWNEMRELQLAWFRTGLESLDVPQDHAFTALVDKKAREIGVKYILNGFNIATEVVQDPTSWSRGGGPTGDGVYVKDVINKYCTKKITEYETTTGLKHKFVMPYIYGIKTIKPLNLVPFTEKGRISILEDEYGYTPYGQKHFESMITKFLEGYWTPTRFGHDIRRAWLSALVITEQMTRDEALKILEQPPLSDEESKELFSMVAKRLEISEEELMWYHEMPECTERFNNQEGFYNLGIKVYEKLGLEKRIRK